MSQPKPGPRDRLPDYEALAAEESFAQTARAFGELPERVSPWLVEFGSWIFAGFIAFSLVVLAALITIGPVDRAILVSATAFALALPLNLAGLFMLRLVQDLTRVGLSDAWERAFREAGLPVPEQAAPPTGRGSREARLTQSVLTYCYAILTVSALLTLTGMVAALWHIAWWIGVAFIAMAIIALFMVLAALRMLTPRQTPADRERAQRYWEEMLKRAQERSMQANHSTPDNASK
jgi:hypothetical protein